MTKKLLALAASMAFATSAYGQAKFTDLPAMGSDAAGTDIFAVVDISATRTEKMTFDQLVTYLATVGVTDGTQFAWAFDTSTTDSDPGNGVFRINNATPASATEIYIDYLSASGLNFSTLLGNVSKGDVIYIESKTDSTDRMSFTVAADPVGNLGHVTLTVSTASGTLPVNGAECSFVIIPVGGFIEGHDYQPSGDWTPSGGTWDLSGLAGLSFPTITTLNITTLDTVNFEIGGVAVTSTAAELNVLDGIPGTLTPTEIGYVDGVTSAIQTQLDARRPLAKFTEVLSAGHTVSISASTGEGYDSVHYIDTAATIELPAVASGTSFTFITIGAIAVTIDVNASDGIRLDGGAFDADGDSITNSSTAGDMVVFTYYSATGWLAMSDGNWTAN